jgi:transcriptional/translational regulatory protein YebC/TACO1
MAGESRWAGIRRRGRALAAQRGGAREPRSGQQLVRFEGYGPGGAALLVVCLTADRASCGAQLRRAFLEHGGNLGADGSVSYLFNTVGLMTYPPGTDEEQLMQAALEAGAEDVVSNGDRSVEVLADPLELDTVRAVLTHRGFAPVTAEVTQRAAAALELSGEPAELMVRLLQTLQGLEDVCDVYSNVQIADEVLARLRE